MRNTRRLKRGGGGGFGKLVPRKKSPVASLNTLKRNLEERIHQKEKEVRSVKQVIALEGLNTSEELQEMEAELKALQRQLSNLHAGTSSGGKRTRKQRRRRMTRRR